MSAVWLDQLPLGYLSQTQSGAWRAITTKGISIGSFPTELEAGQALFDQRSQEELAKLNEAFGKD
jgi:urocanate hydratase